MAMASRTSRLVLGLLLAVVILTLLHESDAKGSRSSRVTSRRSQARRQRKPSGSRSLPKQKVVKPKTFRSSVTYNQAQFSKNKPFTKRFVTAAATGVLVFHLLKSPVYTRHYRPYHETSNIVIPKHRALRVAREEYRVQASDNSSCPNGTLTQYDAENVINVTTKVSYSKAEHVVGAVKPIPPLRSFDAKETNLTISANAIDDYVTYFEIRIFFNQTILQTTVNDTNTTASNGTNTTMPMDLRNCTVLVYEAKAFVIEQQSFAFKNTASFVLFLFAFLVQMFLN